MPPKPAHLRTHVHRSGGGAAIRFRDELEGAPASGFVPGEAIEFNSMSHGGWMQAYVDAVYADGKLRLLAEPDRGAPRSRQAVLRDRVPPEEYLVRHRRPAGSTTPQPRTVHGDFSVGQHVEYLSQTLGGWIHCIVARVHHDGALDLDREDGKLHTRANPTLVRQWIRHGIGAPAGISPLRADRSAEQRRAMEQAEMDRRRQRARTGWNPGALTAATLAEAARVCDRLMSTRKERSPSLWLTQAEQMLDQLEAELEAIGVAGGPRHPDLADLIDNFIAWLESNFVDVAERSARRRHLRLRCTTLATPLARLPATPEMTGGARGGGGHGGGEYSALRLDPVGRDAAGAGDYDSTPVTGQSTAQASAAGMRDLPTDRGRPEPAGTEIEISHHPISVVNGVYSRGGGGPRKHGFHAGYPFYSKPLQDGTAVHLFFSDQFTSWFLSRSPTMDPTDMLYVGRLPLEQGWKGGASHVQWEADSSIALPTPPLGRHVWRCQTRWVPTPLSVQYLSACVPACLRACVPACRPAGRCVGRSLPLPLRLCYTSIPRSRYSQRRSARSQS